MKIFFALIFIVCCCHCPSVAQSEDVQWFKGLFKAKSRASAESEIETKENERTLSVENNDANQQVKILMALGGIYLSSIRTREAAMEFFIQSLELEDSLRLDHEKIFTLLAIARVFEEVEDYTSSAEYVTQAETLNKSPKDPDIEILILEEEARVQTENGNTDAAIEKYKQILTYATDLELRKQQGDALFNLGRLYMLTRDYNQALAFHKQALAIRRSMKDKVSEALSLNSFADVYMLMNNQERAMANHRVALEIKEELKDTAGMAFTYNRVAEIYLKNKDYTNAIANLKFALKAGMETEQQEEIRKSYDYLSISFKALKDFSTALYYRESFLAIDDFIRNEKSVVQLTSTRNRYMLFQKEKEINQLEAGRKERDEVIEGQSRLQTFLFVLIGLIAVILVLLAYLYFVKRKLAAGLTEVNDAKDKLFSIIGHDIKGPLNSLMSFSSLLTHHGDVITKEEIKMISADVDKSLKNLFSLLENLLQWARTQTGNMDFNREDFDITTLLNENKQLLSGQATQKNISLVGEYTTPLIVKGNVNSINTVIRNLLSNAIKFTPANGKIILRAVNKEDYLLISIVDNGVGMDGATLEKLFKLGTKHSTLGTAKEKGTGLGLILCKEFVEKNGGEIGVSSKEGEGSEFYFTVPVD